MVLVSRTYRDPIHNEIHLDSSKPVEDLLIKLIDSREVQRLRWIRQLGTSWYTFHGAEHSRFPHSLGAMHIARQIFDQIAKEYPHDLSDDQAPVLCAALLHDIGHGPFSHSCEKIIELKHEEWTIKLIESEDTEVNSILKEFDPELPAKVAAVLKKTYPKKFLSNIVSSQLDCDRFDYLMRDSHMTGTSYGHFDLNRVISSLTVNEEKDCLAVSGEKGMLAVEDYLYARYSMHLQVYQHKKSLATDALLRMLFKRLKSLVIKKKISYIDKEIYLWITNPRSMSVKEFLLVDDVSVLHHMKHWTREQDYILRDLARRFLTRKLFKSSKVVSNGKPDPGIEEKLQELKSRGLSQDYYLEQITVASDPYSFYNPNIEDYSKAIFVQYPDSQLKEISEVSNIVSALVKGDYQNSWLVSI